VAYEDGESQDGGCVMIFGRHPNLWLGFTTAVWNVIYIANVLTITPEVFGSVNVMLGAAIALVANTNSISIEAGRTALRQEQASGNSTSAPR